MFANLLSQQFLPDPDVHRSAVDDLRESILSLHEVYGLGATGSSILALLGDLLNCPDGADLVSPWAFLLYGELVPALSVASGAELASQLLESLLKELGRPCPPSPQLIAYGDEQVPHGCWQALLKGYAQEPSFPPDLTALDATSFARVQLLFGEARACLQLVDPDLFLRLEALQRVIVLTRPGPISRSKAAGFGGATMMFFWRGTVLNGERLTSTAAFLEQMVHEYGHAALFALGKDELLCLNDDNDRYTVSVRSDPRPINGILHAFYVSTLVANVFDRLGRMSSNSNLPLSTEHRTIVLQRADVNGHHARDALRVIEREARLTTLGEQVVHRTALLLGSVR